MATANYLRNLASFSYPAAIGTNGNVVFNAAAEAAFVLHPSDRRSWIHGIDAVRATHVAKERTIGLETIVFFPIFDDEDCVEAVAGVTATLADLPRVLHAFRRESTAFTDVMHHAPSIVLTARPAGTIDYLSRRWYEIAANAVVARDPAESLKAAIPEDDYRAFARAWSSGVASLQHFALTTRVATNAGIRAFELSVRPVLGSDRRLRKWVGSLSDIEDAVVTAGHLAQVRKRLQILAETGKAIAGARTLPEIAEGVANLSGINPRESWFVELRAATGMTIRRGISTQESAQLAAMLLRGERWGIFGPDGAVVEPSLYVVSAIAEDGAMGGFLGFTRDGKEAPEEEEAALTGEVANRVAIGIGRVLSFMRQQELAHMLQRSMLPLALPYSPGVRLDVAYEPAQREALVGGDWYDAFELSDGTIAVSIGDVAGHGFEAAVVMNQVRHAMRTTAMNTDDPVEILSAANRLVNAQRQPMVTAFVGIFDPLTLSIRCASAGHPPAIVVRDDGTVRSLECEGIPLGVSEELFAKSTVEELPAGGALVLYTDGVVEDERDLAEGEHALAEALSQWAKRGFVARAADLQSSLRVGTHQDDAAMFVLRFPHVDEFEVRLPATRYNAQRMRLAARRFVSGSPFEPDRKFNAELSVGEAVNNAVEHAYGDGGGIVTLVLKRETQRLIVDVLDDGVWREPDTYDRMHGLGIIERLADTLEIHHGEHGTRVHIEIAYRAPSAATPADAVQVH